VLLLAQAQWQQGAGRLGGQPVVPVVIDPFLCRQLRPHQREGVVWMWVSGMKHARPGPPPPLHTSPPTLASLFHLPA
jgi:hypothetical protein